MILCIYLILNLRQNVKIKIRAYFDTKRRINFIIKQNVAFYAFNRIIGNSVKFERIIKYSLLK